MPNTPTSNDQPLNTPPIAAPPSNAAQAGSTALKPDDGHRRHRDTDRNNSNAYYPLGSAFDYWNPNWSGYDNEGGYNQPQNSGLFDQPNADVALPYDQSVNAPPTAITSLPPPDTSSPKLSAAMMASPQWRDANAQLQIAQAEYDAAANRVLAQLRSQPSYQAAVALKQHDSQHVASLKAKSSDPTISGAAVAAADKLDAAKTVTDMETAALQADPKASAAKEKLDAAVVLRHEARQAVEASLPRTAPAPAR